MLQGTRAPRAATMRGAIRIPCAAHVNVIAAAKSRFQNDDDAISPRQTVTRDGMCAIATFRHGANASNGFKTFDANLKVA
jgi:hypothetical protein